MATWLRWLLAIPFGGHHRGKAKRATPILLAAAVIALGAACSPGGGDAAGGSIPTAVASPAAIPATPTPLPTASPTPVPTATARKPLPGPTAPPISPDIASKAETVLTRTSTLRSLPVKDRVPVSTLARSQLQPYLVELFERDNAKADLQKDWATLVLLDLLKEGDDLYRLWLGLLSEQVVGLYEFQGREMKLVGIGDRLAPADEVTLAHEYVHALQDQHFDLGARLKRAKGVGESALGLKALSEGDATVAMGLYAQQHLTPDQRAAMANQSGQGSQEKLRSAPLVLRMNLLFPYLQGTAFVAALAQQGGWSAVDGAYASPPVTSEQILHPEKYLAGEGAGSVKMPDVAAALGSQWYLWKEDTLGELGVLTYLAAGVPAERAAGAAAGWGGDRALLFRSSSGYRYALVVATTWDTPEDAAEFYSAVQELRSSRGGEILSMPDHGRMSWMDGSRGGYAAISGSQVVLAMASDESTVRKIVAALEPALAGGS